MTISKQAIDEQTTEYRRRNPRLSERMAKSMSVARAIARAGIYAEAFLAPTPDGYASSGVEVEKARRDIDARIAKMRQVDKRMSHVDALRLVRQEHPELFS